MGASAHEIVMESRQEIVDKLIAQMEKGYASTRAAWNSMKTGRPYNSESEAVYNGINRFRLMFASLEHGYEDPRWMTYKQAKDAGYRIKAGAKSVLLEKWIYYKEVPCLDENGEQVIGADGQPQMKKLLYKKPIVNYFRVFNAEQIIGVPEYVKEQITEDQYSDYADKFEKSSKCPVCYENQDSAYYSAVEDKIHLPPKAAFKNNETRLGVLLHEMAHSTGHESRLNRPLLNAFGTPEYAKEELNAELTSLFLENNFNISIEPESEIIKDHANYVKSWLAVLKKEPDALFDSCRTAEKISDYLLENYRELEHSRNVENVRSETVAEETGISRQGESFARQEMLQEMRAEMGFGNMIL